MKTCEICGYSDFGVHDSMVDNCVKEIPWRYVSEEFETCEISSTVAVCDSCRTKPENLRMHYNKKLREVEEQRAKRVRQNAEKILFSAGVGKRHISCTIDNFRGKIQAGTVGKQIKIEPSESNEIQAVARYDNNENVIIQSEKAGNGKTHLSIALAREYMMKNGSDKIYVINSAELIMQIKSTFDDKNKNERDIIEPLANKYDLLVIDDIGSEYKSDYALSILYIIMNRRWQQGDKPTITNTNMTSRQLVDAYGAPLTSRLCAGRIITISGDDRRIKGEL